MATIRKILLVDDAPDSRMIAGLSLKTFGKWNVVTANTGQEALTLAVKEQPDLILLDVMMPGMDGTTALQHLQQQESTTNIPVIFMTAKTQRHEIDRLLSLGARGVIVKPIDPITLPDEIRRLMAAV
jgi:CheY-like chemotaxis protein